MPNLGLESFGYGSNVGDPSAYRRTLQSSDDDHASAKLAQLINTLKLQQAQQDATTSNAASNIYGNSFLDVLGAGGSGAPPDPSQAPAPSPGASSQPNMPQVSRIPPGAIPPQQPSGPPGVPNVSPMSSMGQGQAPPQQMDQPRQPQPSGFPSTQQNMTWQSIAAAIKRQAPNAPGAVVAQVIDKYAPLMSAQAKNDWNQQKMQLQQQMLAVHQANTGLGISNNQVRQQNNFGQQVVPTPGAPGGQGMPQANGSDLRSNITANDVPSSSGATGAGGGPSVVPTARTKMQNAEATALGKSTEDWFTNKRPQIQQTLNNLDGIKAVLNAPGAFQTGGLAPEWRAQGDAILGQLFGSGPDSQQALSAQLQQKGFAQILADQIMSSAGTGSGGRSLAAVNMQKLQATAKMDPSKIPATNKAIAENLQAMNQTKLLEGDFRAKWAQKNGVYDGEAQDAFDSVLNANPLFKQEKNGTVTYQPSSVPKIKAGLDKVLKGGGTPAVPQQDDPSRELTPEEMDEYRQLGGQ